MTTSSTNTVDAVMISDHPRRVEVTSAISSDPCALIHHLVSKEDPCG